MISFSAQAEGTPPFPSSRTDQVARVLVLLGVFCLPWSAPLSSLIGIGAFVSLFGGHFKHKLSLIFQFKMSWLVVLFLLFLLLSFSYTIGDLGPSLVVFKGYADKLLVMLFVIPLFMESRWRRRAVNTLILTTVLESVIFIWDYGYLLSPKTIFHSNTAGLAILKSFTIYLLLIRSFEEKKRRWLNVSLLLIVFFALYFVDKERVGMLTGLVLIALAFLQHYRWRGVLASLVVVPCLAVGTYYTSHMMYARTNKGFREAREALSTQYTSQPTTSIGIRIDFIKKGLTLIKRRPFLGYGVGSLPVAFKRLTLETSKGYTAKVLENSYLRVGVQIGLLGLSVFLALLVMQYYECFYFPRQEQRFLTALLLTSSLGALTVNTFHMHSVGFFYATFMGIFFASRFDRSCPQKESQEKNATGKPAL